MADKDNPENEFEDKEEYQFGNEDIFQFDDDDDEFQFTDDDDELEEQDDDDDDDDGLKPATGPLGMVNEYVDKIKKEGIKNNIVPVAIGAIVVLILLFSVYKLFTTLFAEPEQPITQQKVEKPAPVKQATPTKQQAQQNETVEASIESLPVPDQTGFDMPTTTVTVGQPEQLASMQQKIMELEQTMQQIDKTNSALVESIDALQKQNTSNIARMESLAKGIYSIQSQTMKLNNALTKIVETAEKESSVVPTSQTVPATSQVSPIRQTPPPPVAAAPTQRVPLGQPIRKDNMGMAQPSAKSYYVQAIIPGRAWLKDNSGKIFTVTVGDLVPGYGRISVISAENGYVLTDKGTKIEYGIDQF